MDIRKFSEKLCDIVIKENPVKKEYFLTFPADFQFKF